MDASCTSSQLFYVAYQSGGPETIVAFGERHFSVAFDKFETFGAANHLLSSFFYILLKKFYHAVNLSYVIHANLLFSRGVAISSR
jgi:hypothetical protein